MPRQDNDTDPLEVPVPEGEQPPEGGAWWLPWETPNAEDIEYDDFDPLPASNPFEGGADA